MSSHRVALYWLRRDLRLADNPALDYALQKAQRVVFAYVHAPDEEAPWEPGAASRWWLHQSLASLEKELTRLHQRIILRRGPSVSTLSELIATSGASLVVWNRVYEPACVARDRIVATQLTALNIEVRAFNAALFFEPEQTRTQQGAPYRVFTPFWRACATRLDAQEAPRRAPRALSAPLENIRSEPLAALELLPKVRWYEKFVAHWTPGEAGAHAMLRAFVSTREADYARARDFPATLGTSRLSPHLHFGEIGPRQILAACREHRSSDAFLRELMWREFAHHLLFHFPNTDRRPFNSKFEALAWRRDAPALKRWREGRTGFPIVDAGMRELWATGYMHNRVRMLVASLLTKNLGIHWLDGARWFWDTLVDADLANNTLGWQWTAGCGADAAPYFRIFNPKLQGARYDPEGEYIRRWVPELARLSKRSIHAPHLAESTELEKAGVALGKTYPMPIVDLAETRERALRDFKTLGA